MFRKPLISFQLAAFLESRGLAIRECFWEQVEEECTRSSTSERNLVLDQVPWNGLAVVSISFSKGSIYKELQGSVWKGTDIDADALYINGIILEVKYFTPNRISLSSGAITSHITFPTCRVRLITPSLEDVHRSWDAMFSIGKEFEKYNCEQSAALENVIVSLLDG